MSSARSFFSLRCSPLLTTPASAFGVVALAVALSACGKTVEDDTRSGGANEPGGGGGGMNDAGVTASSGAAAATGAKPGGATSVAAVDTSGASMGGSMGGSKPGTGTEPPVMGGGTTPPISVPGMGPITLPPIMTPGGSVGMRPTPTGCMMPTVMESSTGECSGSISCDNNTFTSYCKSDGKSAYCGCNDAYGSQQFEVTGSTVGLCGKLLERCKAETPPAMPAADACRLSGAYSSSYDCNVSRECSEKVDLDGASAVVRTYENASCYQGVNGGLDCNCSIQNQSLNYHLDKAAASIETCTKVLEICGDGEVPDTTGTPTCNVTGRSESTQGCSYESTCNYSKPVSDGISAFVSQYSSVSCYENQPGLPWQCYCSSNTAYISFELAAGAGRAGVCTDLSAACKAADPNQLLTKATCKRSQQSASQGSCYATLDCVGDGKLGDTAVSLHGSIQVSCSPDASNGYQCQCSGATSKLINVDAKEEWSACEQASVQCETQVNPGANGGGFGGGIAFPGKPVPLAG